MQVEEINPYGGHDAKHRQVRAMFNNIAPAYDMMNRMMTMGIDRRWRRKAVRAVADTHPKAVLDIATGTGDLAISLARNIADAHITGIDLSDGMLNVGREKVSTAGLDQRIDFQVGDALNLPFADNTFDAITVAFGVRNFEHLRDGYAEMFRVLRPGATLCVLELSTPANAFVKPFYNIYTRGIIPLVGRVVSRDSSAYTYLPRTIRAVPARQTMTEIMTDAGFTNARYRSLTFGVCTMYLATKP